MVGSASRRNSQPNRQAVRILVMERRADVDSVRFNSDRDEMVNLVRFDEHQDRLSLRLDGLIDFGFDLGR